MAKNSRQAWGCMPATGALLLIRILAIPLELQTPISLKISIDNALSGKLLAITLLLIPTIERKSLIAILPLLALASTVRETGEACNMEREALEALHDQKES